jgi:hypothetical protein
MHTKTEEVSGIDWIGHPRPSSPSPPQHEGDCSLCDDDDLVGNNRHRHYFTNVLDNHLGNGADGTASKFSIPLYAPASPSASARSTLSEQQRANYSWIEFLRSLILSTSQDCAPPKNVYIVYDDPLDVHALLDAAMVKLVVSIHVDKTTRTTEEHLMSLVERAQAADLKERPSGECPRKTMLVHVTSDTWVNQQVFYSFLKGVRTNCGKSGRKAFKYMNNPNAVVLVPSSSKTLHCR